MPNYLKIFLLILIILPPFLSAETYVSGEVSGTWTREGSPYYVLGDSLILPQDSLLTVEAGVEVIFTENDQVFFINGDLTCLGEFQDSVVFKGDTGIIWTKFVIASIPGTGSIHLEYTVLEDCIVGIRIEDGTPCLTLHNCAIRDSDASILGWGTPVDITDCEIANGINITCTGGVFTGNHVGGAVYFYYGGFMEISNNVVEGWHLLVKRINSHLENNICDYIEAGGEMGLFCNVTAINNTCGNFDVDHPAQTLIENNTINGILTLEESESCTDVLVTRNWINACITLNQCGHVTIENNSVLGNAPNFYAAINLIEAYDVNIRNNILTGYRGIEAPLTPWQVSIDYNNVFVSDSAFVNCQPWIGNNNVFEDPMYIDGDPFDFNVKCGSAAVDAGDPESPLDPDSTRADIGTEFFDWRENHPPNSFISFDSLERWVDETVEFYVWAYDDAPGLEWLFDMPEWLTVIPGFDVWETDTVHISGTVPPLQDSFTIQAITEDAEGLTDTVSAYVFVYPTNYLRGSLSGVLDITYSPYVVYEDITVEEEDTLTIMPGVELQFMETGFDVYGKLICEGTAEDSITFTTAIMEPEPEVWENIYIFHDSQDTIRFKYCLIEYAFNGAIGIDSGSVQISNCSFFNCYSYLIIGFYNSYGNYGLLEFNYIDSSNEYGEILLRNGICQHNFFNGGGKISLKAPGAIAEYNLFYESDMGITASSNSIVRYNQIHNIDGYALYNYGVAESPLFHDNYVKGCEIGAKHIPWINQASKPQFYNNVFEDCEVGFYSETCRPDTSYVYNNVFRNCDVGIESHGDQDILIHFENNSITDCDTAFKVASPDHISFLYNNIYNNGIDFVGFPAGTGNLTGVNANGDSCDIGHNIYFNPMFGGGEPFNYHLHEGSPLIDAGNPAPQFFDPDSTINDIGFYGGLYGESYPYLGAISPQSEAEIPSEFTLTQNFPNPFNNSTSFIFTLPEIADVSIGIYNVLGQLVKDYSLEKRQPGVYRVVWDGVSSSGEHVSSGIYLCTVDIGDEQKTITMMLVK